MPRSARNLTNAPQAVFTLRIERDKLDRFREVVEREHRTVVQDLRHYIDRRLAEERERAA